MFSSQSCCFLKRPSTPTDFTLKVRLRFLGTIQSSFCLTNLKNFQVKFIAHSFIQHLLNVFFVPVTVCIAGNTEMNQARFLPSFILHSGVDHVIKTVIKYMDTYFQIVRIGLRIIHQDTQIELLWIGRQHLLYTQLQTAYTTLGISFVCFLFVTAL